MKKSKKVLLITFIVVLFLFIAKNNNWKYG